jgi:hypothetical protein
MLRVLDFSGSRPLMPTSAAAAELGGSCTKAVVGETLVAE